MNLLEFSGIMGSVAIETERLLAEQLELACEVIEHSAKEAIGTYDFGWQELAEVTKKDRVSKGYPENEPLLRTGELRDSIQHNVSTVPMEAYVGSDNWKAPIHEFGVVGPPRIPPRPFLGGAVVATEHEVTELFVQATRRAFRLR